MVKNGLNISRDYCLHWGLDQAIREVVQNTIDGAVEWIHEEYPDLEKSDLRPWGMGWHIDAKAKPLKKFRDAGFEYGGKAELILTIHQQPTVGRTLQSETMRDWHEDDKSLAYIKMEIASRDPIDWREFKEKGRQPPGTVLVRFQTINRVVDTFRMYHLQRIGKTLKRGCGDQAGQFGEGFKVGAVVAARNRYSLVVEKGEERRAFMIKKCQLCYEKQDSRIRKDARTHPQLIYVELLLKQPPTETGCTDDYHHFNPSFFRLLSPGVPFSKDGVVITKESDQGNIFCMGIFVTRRQTLLLAYDFPQKDLVSGRDRNGSSIHSEKLHACIQPLLEQKNRDNKNFMLNLFKKIQGIEEEVVLRKTDEVMALFESKELCESFADCFRNEHGAEAFPCRESEQKQFDETFKNRNSVVLPPTTVDLLREGGYRSIEEEIDFLFSNNNMIEVSADDEPLVRSCRVRLNLIDENYQIDRESLLFIDGRFLNDENNDLRCRSEDEKFYINNAMLLQSADDQHPFLRASNRLGYAIATRVGGVDDFGFRYSEKNDSCNPWFTFEVAGTEGKDVIRACHKMCEAAKEVHAKHLGSDDSIVFDLAGFHTVLPSELVPGNEYSFEAVAEDGNRVLDPLTQQSCVCTHKMSADPPPVGAATATDSESNEADTESVGTTGNIGMEGSVSDGGGVDVDDRQNRGNFENRNRRDSIGFPTDSDSEEESVDSDIEGDLTVDELMSIFGNEEDVGSYGSDSESDEEENEHETKRPRKTLPKDETSARFGSTEIIKGQVYTVDERMIRIIEFTGQRFPVRGARVEIICTLPIAIHNHLNGIEGLKEEFHEHVVFEESQVDAKFLEKLRLYDGHQDFDDLIGDVDFQLTRNRKGSFFFELKRLSLDLPDEEWTYHKEKPSELVLFAGVGGSSIGDKKAGFDVSWLVEKDSLAAASLRDSHPSGTIFGEDVRLFLDKCECEQQGYPERGQVDHLQASPPGNGFSDANRGGGKNDNENNSLSYEVVRAVEILNVRTGVMENVPGILRPKHFHHSASLLLGLINLGYQVRIAVLDASKFGDPQSRQRAIFTFARGDTPLPEMPKATHEDCAPRTLRDAIRGLPVSCDMKQGSGLVRLPCGGLTFNHVASGPTRGFKVLDLDDTVNTITTQNTSGLVHPLNEHRSLSIRELARLFSYPDDKQFFGSLTAMRRQIGNSVPVELAKAVALPIIDIYNELNGSSAFTTT